MKQWSENLRRQLVVEALQKGAQLEPVAHPDAHPLPPVQLTDELKGLLSTFAATGHPKYSSQMRELLERDEFRLRPSPATPTTPDVVDRLMAHQGPFGQREQEGFVQEVWVRWPDLQSKLTQSHAEALWDGIEILPEQEQLIHGNELEAILRAAVRKDVVSTTAEGKKRVRKLLGLVRAILPAREIVL